MDEEKYIRSIYKLHDKCQQIQRENERFVARLHYMKVLSRRQQKDVVLLKGRLDLYNDDWRTAQEISNQKVFRKTKPKGNSGLPASNTTSRTHPNGGAAPITKRKRSLPTNSVKRQSEGRAQEMAWKTEYPLDDWTRNIEGQQHNIKEEEEEDQDFTE